MADILLLEDDKVLSETLSELLVLQNYRVDIAQNGEEAMDLSYEKEYELFLFDVNTPKLNGFELLEALRSAQIFTPAIFITSLDDIASLSKGFEVGADDYIKKPFDFDELLIRIQALIAKSYRAKGSRITYKDMYFDLNSDQLYRNDLPVKLTQSEKKILKMFLKNLNITLSKEQIFDAFDHLSDGTLRVHLSALRKHGFEITSDKPVGYRLEKA